MFADYLRKVAIAYPDHPLAKQELTVTFTCWIASIQNQIGHGLTFSYPPKPGELDILWMDWQEYHARAEPIHTNNTHPPSPGS